MTKTNYIDAFSEATCRVLEEQVFMFGEPCEKENLLFEAPSYVMASVNFNGLVVGKSFWIASEAFGQELAANILGIDLNDPLALSGGHDALKELSNVICCQCLTSVYGSEPVFHLDSPLLQPLNLEDLSLHIKSQETTGIVVDEHAVLLGFTLLND